MRIFWAWLHVSKWLQKCSLSLRVVSQRRSGTDTNTCNLVSLFLAGKKHLHWAETEIISSPEISCANRENKQASVPLDLSPEEKKNILTVLTAGAQIPVNYEKCEITTAPSKSCSPSLASSQILTFFSTGLTSSLWPWVFLNQTGVCSSQISSSEEAKKFSRVCETVFPLTNRDCPLLFWRRELTE